MTDTARLAQLEARVRKYEEDEASVCPEDVGFVEWIGVLKRRAETAEAALKVYQMLFTQPEIRDSIEVLNAYHPRVPKTTTDGSLQSAGSNAADAAAQAERE